MFISFVASSLSPVLKPESYSKLAWLALLILYSSSAKQEGCVFVDGSSTEEYLAMAGIVFKGRERIEDVYLSFLTSFCLVFELLSSLMIVHSNAFVFRVPNDEYATGACHRGCQESWFAPQGSAKRFTCLL